MKKNTKRDWTSEIAGKFIEALEKGVVPWVKPWEHWTSWNDKSGADYRGVNQLLLGGGAYMTFNQIKEAGGKLNKGSKGTHVVKYGEYMKKITDEETGEEQKIPSKYIKAFTVFSLDDTDLEVKHEKKQVSHDWNAEERAEEIVKAYTKQRGIEVRHGGNKAFNAGSDNSVNLPRRKQFKSAPKYYGTVFHELVHSTAQFVGRDLSDYAKSKKARAREELVAEIGAAYILSYLGIEGEFENSAAYVKSWAEYLKDDNAAILYATPKAIEAGNLILKSCGEVPQEVPKKAEQEAPAEEPKAEKPEEGPNAEAIEAATEGKMTKHDYRIMISMGRGKFITRTVAGYVTTIKGVYVGITKDTAGQWTASELTTGAAIKPGNNTRKEAVEFVKEYAEMIRDRMTAGKLDEAVKAFAEAKPEKSAA